MSDGITHARYATVAATGITVAAAVAAVAVHPACTGLALGAWAGLLVTPDRDHPMVTIEEIRIRRFNPVLAFITEVYWWPYTYMRPHRGKSHDFPIGAVERFVYFMWFPIAWSFYYSVAGILPLVAFWLMAIVGYAAQDAVHLWKDGLM